MLGQVAEALLQVLGLGAKGGGEGEGQREKRNTALQNHDGYIPNPLQSHLPLPLTDGVDEEVDKPSERVLVHWVDVGHV